MKAIRLTTAVISYMGVTIVTVWMLVVLAFAFLASPPKMLIKPIKRFDSWIDKRGERSQKTKHAV